MTTMQQWSKETIAKREDFQHRHEPTTPRTYDELLARCELYINSLGPEWMNPPLAGFIESVSRARREKNEPRR